MSDGEGSLYDKGLDEEELNKKRKKRRKEMLARGPVSGEKTQKKRRGKNQYRVWCFLYLVRKRLPQKRSGN
jgi:hypothetical protein